MVPLLAEYENGFIPWLTKINNLSVELSVPIQFSCSKPTENAIIKQFNKLKMPKNFSFHYFDDWDDFLILSRFITDDDLLILV